MGMCSGKEMCSKGSRWVTCDTWNQVRKLGREVRELYVCFSACDVSFRFFFL